jgi:CRISPR-associated protein Csh1
VIDDCLAIFERQGDIDKLVMDYYVLGDGTYIIIKYKAGKFVLPEKPYIIVDDKNALPTDEREMLKRMDYYCNCINTNKAVFVPSGRMILSNNYLSFFIANKDFSTKRLINEIIDGYYKKFKELNNKPSKRKDDVGIYGKIEKELGTVDENKVDLIHDWIKTNIFYLQEKYKIEGTYLKIFFVFDDSNYEADFKREGQRYFLSKVYNKNEYNVKINDTIYGVTDNNICLNDDKPFMWHYNRKNNAPIMENLNKVMVRKKFFDYLLQCYKSGSRKIFFQSVENGIGKIQPIYKEDDYTKVRNLNGYYLVINNTEKQGLCVIEADNISYCGEFLKRKFEFKNILDVPDYDGDMYVTTNSLSEVERYIDDIFFSKKLLKNISNKIDDINIDDKKIKKAIILYRNAYRNWFYSGYDEDMEAVVGGTADIVIQNAIDNNNYKRVQYQFNLKWSLIEYFRQGGEKMADVLKQHRDTIRQKINTDWNVYVSIDNDEEYCYSVGQLINYLLGFSKPDNKSYSHANQFFKIKDDKLLKERLNNLFLKYNYAEKMNTKRFEKLYGMVCSYGVEKGLNQDIMIAGYISPSLIYEKGDK